MEKGKGMEILVSEIHKRKVLWDRSCALYRDRSVTDKEWDELTKIAGISKRTAKKKWRNLRDHFFKEYKRIPKSKEDDPATSYPGKWKFFRKLLFLKDTMTPNDNDDNDNDDNNDNEDNDNDGSLLQELENFNLTKIKPEVESEEDSNSENEDSQSNIELTENGVETSFNEITPTVRKEPSFNEITPTVRKRKRLDMEQNDVNLQLLGIETKKLAMLEASEDESSLYLRSLAPFLRKMDPIRQLRVRTKFQDILLKEMEQMQRQNKSTLYNLSSDSDNSAPASTKS